MEEYKIDMPGV